MDRWGVYSLSDSGKRLGITTVFANSETEARTEAERQLSKPGRRGYLQSWIESGRIVIREDN